MPNNGADKKIIPAAQQNATGMLVARRNLSRAVPREAALVYLARPTAFMTSPMPLLPVSMNAICCAGAM